MLSQAFASLPKLLSAPVVTLAQNDMPMTLYIR